MHCGLWLLSYFLKGQMFRAKHSFYRQALPKVISYVFQHDVIIIVSKFIKIPGRTLRSKVSSSKETPLLSFRGSRRRGALCPGSGSVFSRRAELRRVMTSPHWAEGSVAVVGVPAGGSWLHCVGRWAPSFWSWEVGRRAPSLSFSFQRSWVSFGGVGPR